MRFQLFTIFGALCLGQSGAVPEYKELRESAATETFTVDGVALRRDVGVFRFKSGTITFGPSTLGKVTLGVFSGELEFVLAPAVAYERDYVHSLIGEDSVRDTVDRAVFYFTDGSYTEIKGKGKSAATAASAADVLKSFRQKRRTDGYGNLEAQILADLYNPKRGGLFVAEMHGRKLDDFSFRIHPRGFAPDLGPEEVVLANSKEMFYLAHRAFEYTNGVAPSEQKSTIIAEDFKIDTRLGRNESLSGVTEVRLRAVADGDRVVTFGLLPTLRVSSVRLGGTVLPFIQEDAKKDGELAIVLPEATVKDRTYTVAIEYAGDKVVHDEGGGNFSVGARTSWYPSVNSFRDQATYELSFRVPNRYTLVSVGQKTGESRDGDFTITRWKSSIPITVAGFNYGEYKRQEVKFDAFPYIVEGYATSDLPDYLKRLGDEIGGMTPTRLLDSTLQQTRAAIQLYDKWFGRPPYGRIAITQQPEYYFGQSWPGLVYLPMFSFLDATQRWELIGTSQSFTDFIQEVTPHEVAHQWWGHMVSWESYRDQWLSEGFADFSAGLFLQQTNQAPKYLHFLETARNHILEKNEYGRTANEAGPLTMGFRLSSEKNPGAYNRLVYPKGGYILHMLRSLMWDTQNGDQRFIEMMRDFVQTHLHKTASSASFQAVAEKYMTTGMNLGGNRKLDWFFQEWVNGTDVPHYKFDYELVPDQGASVKLKATLAQSGVSEEFRMSVPIYADFDGKIVRLGSAPVIGNTSFHLDLVLPKKPRKVMINANFDVLAYK